MFLGGSLVSLKLYFLYPSMKTGNITDPDEMLHYVAFHLGLQFLQRCLFRVSGPQRVSILYADGNVHPSFSEVCIYIVQNI